MDAVSAVSAASQIANSQVVWSILCILLTIYVLWHSNNREKREYEREKSLLDNLTELTNAQHEQAKTMEKISDSLGTVEGRLDRMEKYTYKKGENFNGH